jgi:AraC family transcriptional regulator of adaptative response/methylated-DNA-[protein]-cysteine methyltransferase
MENFQENIVAQAIDYLAAIKGEYPDLDALAQKFGYEPTHFQKLFQEKVGISPKRMTQYMTFKRARDFLLEGYPTLEAAHQAGLSGNGRLHDLFVSCEAATPGMVQRRGEGIVIEYGYHPSPLGEILIGQTGAGLCWLGFVVDGTRAVPFERMRAHWPKAELKENATGTAPAAEHILAIWSGKGDEKKKLRLYLHGTNFQIQVWQALLKIPTGGVVSYQDVADALGVPKACRAVGSAVGGNPISLLIPCHRVIQKSGIVENYGWGTPRKKILLGLEAEHQVLSLQGEDLGEGKSA